jgi:predicted O-methyltransferase YrrM
MDIDQALLDRTKGFLDDEEGRQLYTIAQAASRLGPCLEIGSYCGKSAIYLGAGCKSNGGILFSIDHHRGSEEQQPGEEYFDPELFDYHAFEVNTLGAFRRTLAAAGLEDTVVPVVCRSEVAARAWATPLSLVFIDGGHSHAAARSDYHAWEGHLMTGGYLLIHDIFEDPRDGGQAPHEIYRQALATGAYRCLPMVKTLGILQKTVPTDLPRRT